MNELGNTPADKNYRPSGISKAEERALVAYPIHPTLPNEVKDYIAAEQQAYRKGYEQAEKDFALTAEDIGNIFKKVKTEGVKWNATEACYPDVAKWFNEYKKK